VVYLTFATASTTQRSKGDGPGFEFGYVVCLVQDPATKKSNVLPAFSPLTPRPYGLPTTSRINPLNHHDERFFTSIPFPSPLENPFLPSPSVTRGWTATVISSVQLLQTPCPVIKRTDLHFALACRAWFATAMGGRD
jgi:hypothetical protein